MSILTSASDQMRVPDDDEKRWDRFPRFEAEPASQRIDRIKRQVREAAERPLSEGTTNPPEAYTDPDYFAWEVEHILKKDWVCLAHISQIPHPGDYLNFDLFGEPLTLVHGKDGTPRVLSRVCPHRAMDIMPESYGYAARGNQRMFVCPYHRWTFELDGQMKGAPEMHCADNFNKRDWCLLQFRSELWEGFIFVNFSGDAESLQSQYADLQAQLAKWRMADMAVSIEMKWECRANWKVILENWIESYHHLGVHSNTLNTMVPAQDTWVDPEHPHFIRCHLPYKDSLAKQAIQSVEQHDASMGFLPIPNLPADDAAEWGLYIGYPHFQVLTFSDRVIWYRLEPLGPNHTRWWTNMLITKESFELSDYEQRYADEQKMMRDFHVEDMQATESVQRGLESGRAQRGRLSHLDEPVWLIQRWLAARYEGAYPRKGDSLPRHDGMGPPHRRRGANQ
jgi:phenylpropionate dioxygenase-like ring-hydroxylating dioxygenase large terminal subunit